MIRKLIIGNGRSEREILLVGNIIIGRDPACHVSDPDPLLSRRHAEIIANVHGVSVRDLNSRNGILVNGEKSHEQVLLPGDVVQMGHLQLRYIEEKARVADGMSSRSIDPRRQAPAPPATTAYDVDRFRPESTPRPVAPGTPQPGRWRPDPTPLPGRRTSAPPPQPRAHGQTPVPRGRAAFERPGTPRPAHHDTTLGPGPAGLDSTIMAPIREPSGINRWDEDPNATMFGAPLPDSTMTPGNATFASALAHLAGIADPDDEHVLPGPGAHLVANAELTVTGATPGCADMLGMAGEQLIGDSLTDVFLRGVRRAYADPTHALSLSVSRGAHGSITVTFTLDKVGGTE